LNPILAIAPVIWQIARWHGLYWPNRAASAAIRLANARILRRVSQHARSIRSHFPWRRFGLGSLKMTKAVQYQWRLSRRRPEPQVGDVGDNERA
jgi:hypothetical protein